MSDIVGNVLVDKNADPNRVWPTGLTIREAEELHGKLIEGTRIFGAMALVAHLLAFVWSPWLH